MVSKVNLLPIRQSTAKGGTEAAREPEAGFGAAVERACERIKPPRAKGAQQGDAARDGEQPEQAAQTACQAYLAALMVQPVARQPEAAEQLVEAAEQPALAAQGTVMPARQDGAAVVQELPEATVAAPDAQATQPDERCAAFELPSDIAHVEQRPAASETRQSPQVVTDEQVATPAQAVARAAAQAPVEAGQAVESPADTAKSAPVAPEVAEPARARGPRAAKADAPPELRAERAKRDEEVPQTGRTAQVGDHVEPTVAQAARAAPAQSARAAAEPDAAAQVARSIPAAFRRGETQYRLRLRPEGLGEVEVSISARERTLGLTIRAANEEARALIAGQIGELRRELVASNYELGGVSVEVSANAHGGAAFSAFAQQGRHDAQPGSAGASPGVDGMEGDAELRQIREAYAHAGAIMYRI